VNNNNNSSSNYYTFISFVYSSCIYYIYIIFSCSYIDLSKRRVSPEDVAKCEDRYNKAKAVHRVLRVVADNNNLSLKSLYTVYTHVYMCAIFVFNCLMHMRWGQIMDILLFYISTTNFPAPCSLKSNTYIFFPYFVFCSKLAGLYTRSMVIVTMLSKWC
jgi:hypothetical protein